MYPRYRVSWNPIEHQRQEAPSQCDITYIYNNICSTVEVRWLLASEVTLRLPSSHDLYDTWPVLRDVWTRAYPALPKWKRTIVSRLLEFCFLWTMCVHNNNSRTHIPKYLSQQWYFPCRYSLQKMWLNSIRHDLKGCFFVLVFQTFRCVFPCVLTTTTRNVCLFLGWNICVRAMLLLRTT